MSRFIALYVPTPDTKLLRQIGVWCNRFTPFVGVECDVTPELLLESQNRKGLILDMTGMHRLFPDLTQVAKTIFTSLQARHIPIRIGIASTIGAAWAFSRFSSQAVHLADDRPLRSQLSSYPIAALRLTEIERGNFQELGLHTVEDIVAIPIKELAQRFGFSVLRKLDLAFGRIQEPLRILKTKEQLSISSAFDIPLIKHESIKACFLKLLEQLLSALQKKSVNASSFYLKVVTEDKEIITRNISLYMASKNIRHLSQVLEPYIESIKPTTAGGISFVAITALHIQPIHQTQNSFTETTTPSYAQPLGELLNLYRHTLGEKNIRKAAFLTSYIPERSFSFQPLEAKKQPQVLHVAKDRPSYLLATPEQITAISMLPDKAPSWITWRKKAVKIVTSAGPERIASEWWIDGITAANEYRDYFKIHAEDGNTFWVFRNSTDMNWFMHGLWV